MYPAVATFFWVVAALALNLAQPAESPRQLRRWLGLFLPIPFSAAVALGYFFMVYYPAVTSAGLAQGAEKEGRRLFQDRSGVTVSALDRGKPIRNAESFLRKQVLEPLETAAKTNPNDVRLRVQLANWYRVASGIYPAIPEFFDGGVRHAQKAQELDVHGREGYLAEARLLATTGSRFQLRVARDVLAIQSAGALMPPVHAFQPASAVVEAIRTARARDSARAKFLEAAAAMAKAVARDPLEPRSHYQLAEYLFAAGEDAAAQRQVREALRLDEAAPHETRKLGTQQRDQIRAWLKNSSST
jgi:hypothetical protein